MGKMQFGYMMRGQFAQGDDMSVRVQELCEQARLLEKLGYDSLGKGSHYASAPLQDLQQLPLLSRMMAEAPSLRLIAGIILLPLHKPLDLAEQTATIDVMSGGKFVFGVGLGYREVEFRAFDTTMKARVRRFEENLEAIKRLWTEDSVTMKGSHFELMDASISLRPKQRPWPPIWIGANADAGVERAARLGDCWYIPAHNRLDEITRQVEIYKRALDKAGKPMPDELPMRREVFVARTREEALRICRPFLEVKYKVYHQWGQSEAMPEGDGLGLDFDDLLKDRFLIGSPDEVAESLLRIAKPPGVNHFIVSLQWPGMSNGIALDAISLFAEEVMPKVRQGL